MALLWKKEELLSLLLLPKKELTNGWGESTHFQVQHAKMFLTQCLKTHICTTFSHINKIFLLKKINSFPTKNNFVKNETFLWFSNTGWYNCLTLKSTTKLMAILNQLRTTVSSYAIQEQKCVYPSSSSDAISSKNARERVLRLFFLSSSISSLKWLFSFFSCHIKMYLNFRKQQQLCCFSNIKLDFFSSLLKKQVSKKENYHMSDSF